MTRKMISRQVTNVYVLRALNFRKYSVKLEKEPQDYVNLAYASYELTDSKKKAPPLIILHGLLGSKSNWATLCKIYQAKTNPNRQIIALDARNHGDSPHHPRHTYEALSSDLKAFLNNLDIGKASLLGHSMGGGTAMSFSLKHPEIVEKLVVCDFSPTSNNLGDLRSYLEAMEKVKIPKGISMSVARSTAEFQLQQFGIRHRSRRKFLTTNLVRSADGSYGWRVNIPALTMSCKDLSSIRPKKGQVYLGPTLFIGGTNSGYLKPREFSKIRDLFPNSEFKFIEGAGHWVHFDNRKEFAAISLKFLNDNA
ncbi:protein ABHD11-like [Coccinella septempunctata]|uniref:protein ABHD11-like n=1 Tax=Coccinella septempunctata TaxID=41139 RepID=UPI001D062F48|nr:protein ABHD11-like [Coccinella septempunctata]